MTAPVLVESQVAIPAGTFVQGKLEKLKRRGSRGEMLMQSVSIVFPSGYVNNVAIGAIVGGAAGGVVALALLARSHHFYVDAGSAAELTLTKPMTLTKARIADAVNRATTQPPLAVVVPKTHRVNQFPSGSSSSGMCDLPGAPGTPHTVIPGTPAIGDSPGTPPIVIPGTPPGPPIWYPCP
jgi:hypothetical protein